MNLPSVVGTLMNAPLSHLAAICCAIAGFTLFVLCDSAIKLAGRSQLPNYEIVAFLGIFTVAFISAYAFFRGEVQALWPKRPGRMLIRAALDLGNNLFVVIALRHLSLTLFYILIFMSPMCMVILGRVFLKEPLDWRRVCAIVVGFAGVVVAINPFHSNGRADWVGYAACAVCVACFSTAMVWSRVIFRTERAEGVTVFSGLVAASAGLIGMLAYTAPLSLRLMLVLLVMGLLCAVGNICMFIAVKHLAVATVGQYHYTQMVSGAVVAYLLFQEKPTPFMLAGAVLIMASGLYIAVLSRAEPAVL